MIRNKNKPAKPPKPRISKTQVGPHAKRNKNKGKESHQKISYESLKIQLISHGTLITLASSKQIGRTSKSRKVEISKS